MHRKSEAAGAALAAVVATLAIAGTQPAAALAPAITIATSDTGALEVLADASALWVRAPVRDDADTVLARTDDLTYDSTQYWHTGSVAGSSACSFSVTGYGATDGYYRIARPESDNVLAFVSGRVRLHRISTSFGSLSISPTRPCPNRRMTFTGSVTQQSGSKWIKFSHARVVLVYRPKGDTYWYWVVKGWTNSSGQNSLKAPCDSRRGATRTATTACTSRCRTSFPTRRPRRCTSAGS